VTEISVVDRPSVADTVRRARRVWWRAGVRRRDRAALSAELGRELEAAADPRDVVGEDPARTAREWAEEQGCADRRLRLGLVLPMTLVPGILAAGAVLATLYQGFTMNGETILNRVDLAVRMFAYLGTGVLSYLAMLVGASVALELVHDGTRRGTVRALSWALPLAAVVATSAGVATAAALDFDTSRSAVEQVLAAVLVTLAVAVSAARILATRRHHRLARAARYAPD
jgi:hypothetical protein